MGRRVLIEAGKVKYSAPAAHPHRNSNEQAFVNIVGDTSVAMEKTRRPERPTMVAEALRPKVMYECAVSVASHTEAELKATVVKLCLICRSEDLTDLADSSCAFC